MEVTQKPLLEVTEVTVDFLSRGGFGGIGPTRRRLRAVDAVSFEIYPGETVGLVGESGCGKTTLGRAILGLVPITAGSVRFEGRQMGALSSAEMKALRRHMQPVFQDPLGSLDPRMTIEDAIAEGLDVHGLANSASERRKKVKELLSAVGLGVEDGRGKELSDWYGQRYPHELSGGQRQRVGIARALAVEPSLLICDEPVSALDVSVQAQILNLLMELQESRKLALLFIAHDLAVVERMSSRILVMYLGHIVEEGLTAELVEAPRHPYTESLIAAVPKLETALTPRGVLKGETPAPWQVPAGCPFSPRCPRAQAQCQVEKPGLSGCGAGRRVACHFPIEEK